MRPDDIAEVLRIAASLPEAPQWAESAYFHALDQKAGPDRIALVAEVPEGWMAGFLITVLIPPQAELETIVVAREVQRQGIASRLLSALRSMLQKRQITEVMLEVRQSNYAARRLYASAGFAESGRRTGYYRDPKEDAILLSCPVAGAPRSSDVAHR
jgi:ribosomal-protein-alanine N-acetyltransferase